MSIVLLCLFLAFHISVYDNLEFDRDLRLIIAFEAFIVFFFYMYDLYDDTARLEGTTTSVTISVFGTMICTFLINVVFKWYYASNRMWFSVFILLLVLLRIWRFLYMILFTRFKDKEKILIIETVNQTGELAKKITSSQENSDFARHYTVDDSSYDDVTELIENVIPKYDTVFLSPELEPVAADRIYVQALMLGKNLSVLATANNVSVMNSSIRLYRDTPVLQRNGIMVSKLELFIKRAFDIVFALFGLIIFSPLFLISAVMIKLDTPGPVIYKQERYTIGKKRFNILKFRTMVADAEKEGAVFSVKNDPRITRSGHILRACRLDELPQLINILRGDMSVVGPRPERPVFADKFEKTIKDYQLRHLIKAGLTGYAQAYGRYNTAIEDKTLMDLIYLSNRSLLFDLKIIILTVKTMFMKSATEGVDGTEFDPVTAYGENSAAESDAKSDEYKSVGNHSDIQ